MGIPADLGALMGRMFVNLYGEYISEPLKMSEWVIWDEYHLDTLGARKPIADQWKIPPELIERFRETTPG